MRAALTIVGLLALLLAAIASCTEVEHYYLDDQGYCRHRHESKTLGIPIVRYDESIGNDDRCPHQPKEKA